MTEFSTDTDLMLGKKMMSDFTVNIVKLILVFMFIWNYTASSSWTVEFETRTLIIVSTSSLSPTEIPLSIVNATGPLVAFELGCIVSFTEIMQSLP